MRWLLPILALPMLAPLASAPAAAQVYSGPATAIDGDTLVMTGERIRLHGIDAPEKAQTCQRGGASWACGQEATALLATLVADKNVDCTQQDRDGYGRIVATCRVGRSDLSAVMVRAGLAIALPQFSEAYVETEARAKVFRMALWSSEFQVPSEYRAAHPALYAPLTRAAAARAGMAQSGRTAPASVWYRGCNDVRAAGKAPLYRSQPGYRIEMDGDGDGIACEPYRGR